MPEIFDPSLLDGKYLVEQPRRDRGAPRAHRPRGHLRRAVVWRGPRRRGPGRAGDGPRDDRRAAPRRRLEVPLGRNVRPGPRRDRGRPRGRGAAGGDQGRRDARGGRHAGAATPDPSRSCCATPCAIALIEHARREYPNEACGIVVGDRPAAEGGVALRFAATPERGRVAVALPHPRRGPAPADPRDRRRGRGVLGDRPLPRPVAGSPVADRHRGGPVPGRALHPRLAGGLRGRSGHRRAIRRGAGGSSTAPCTRSSSGASPDRAPAPIVRDRRREVSAGPAG